MQHAFQSLLHFARSTVHTNRKDQSKRLLAPEAGSSCNWVLPTRKEREAEVGSKAKQVNSKNEC